MNCDAPLVFVSATVTSVMTK